ncbi:MAG TPA: tetratricopeptide repeat protein [Stellaceae bacterium]|nr:tetratricopeptide repeat protein [Stellaceae bacterium]
MIRRSALAVALLILALTGATAGAKDAPPSRAVAASTGHLHFSEHRDFRRVIFNWHEPVAYVLIGAEGVARLRFVGAAQLDAAELQAALPDLSPTLRAQGNTTVVSFRLPAGVKLRHFRSGTAIVVDILRPGAPSGPRTPAPAVQALCGPSGSCPELQTAKAELKTATAEPRPQPAPAPADSGKGDTDKPAAPGNPIDLAPAAQAVAATAAADALLVQGAATPEGVRLRFDWPKPTAAAVFRRAGAVWIVFATPAALDLAEPRKLVGGALSTLDQIADERATVLRLVPRAGLAPSVRRDGNSWIVELKAQDAQPDTPLNVETRPAADTPSVLFALTDAAEPLRLRDPELGDSLVVVPLTAAGTGALEQSFVDFRVLASVQGLALRPNVDDLIVASTLDGLAVTRPGGLLLAGKIEHRLANLADGGLRLLDFASWRGEHDANFLRTRSRLEHLVTTASPGERSRRRLALAHFYFANFFAAEAEGVLEAIRRDDPDLAADPAVALMIGAAELLTGDRRAAAQDLGRQVLDGQIEATLWRASLAAETGDWPAAARGFITTVSLLPLYPKPLRDRFALEAAEALLETSQPDAVPPILDLVLGGRPSRADEAMALYLDGRRADQQGDRAHAIERWTAVAGMGEPRSRVRSLIARATAQLETKEISRADAIKVLDGLRFDWRGDFVEFELLRRLGELQLAEGDRRDALDTLREAAVNFPDYPAAKAVMTELSDAVAEMFLGDAMKNLSPLKALALYDEFKDFTPVGERGDRILSGLVDRLVAVDLLDRAAALLSEQIEHRLQGHDKARAATQLALLRLLDHKPEAALQALAIPIDRDAPVELLRQRVQLRARALTDLQRPDEALAVIADDHSRDADRLRADIFWHGQKWGEVVTVLSRLAPTPPSDGKLDDGSTQLVLNLAAAMILAGDKAGLSQLRTVYGKAMSGTPSGDAFHVLAGESAPGAKDVDPREFASHVAQLSELQGFMTSLRGPPAKN